MTCVRRRASISVLVRRVLGLSSNNERARASGRALEVELVWSGDLLLARSFPRPTAERRSVGHVWMSGACCVWFRVRRVFVSHTLCEAPLMCSSLMDFDDTSTDARVYAAVSAAASSSRAEIVAAYTGCTFVTGNGELIA